MANPSWVDTLAGLFENPLFQFGANLAALSGKHRFGEALGGAIAASGKTAVAAKKQKKLEELQAESLGIRKDYNALLKSKVEADIAEKKGITEAGSQLEAALANVPGISPTQRLLAHYQLSKGIAPTIGLTPAQQATIDMRNQPAPLSTYQGALLDIHKGEQARKTEEATRKVAALEKYRREMLADPTLSPQQKRENELAIDMGRLPQRAKSQSDIERDISDALAGRKNLPAGGALEAPAPSEPGWIGSGMNWLSGKAHELLTPGAHPLGVGGTAWTGGGTPATPLAPPVAAGPLAPPATPAAQDPAALLTGLESSLKVLNSEERGVAKLKLQQMLANPALSGLHERIRGLFGQL